MNSITHRFLSDGAFENAFKNLSLDPALFTHEAHLRLAWIYIHKYGVDKASNLCSEQIKAFASFHGDKNKFHKTITVTAVNAVNHFIKKSNRTTFDDFILENTELLTKFRQLLNSHYSIDILSSQRARQAFLPPDLEPFN